jgi:hypothetical protein
MTERDEYVRSVVTPHAVEAILQQCPRDGGLGDDRRLLALGLDLAWRDLEALRIELATVKATPVDERAIRKAERLRLSDIVASNAARLIARSMVPGDPALAASAYRAGSVLAGLTMCLRGECPEGAGCGMQAEPFPVATTSDSAVRS